jgi:peptide/nickel transport system permease protein
MTVPVSDITAVTPEGAVAPAAELGPPPGRGKRRRLRFVANAKAATGLTIVGVYAVFAVIGPWVAPYDPGARSQQLVAPPSAEHWFGTTHLGQDIFSQVLVGTRGVMLVGFTAGAIATVLSILVGVTSGYLSGVQSEALSALANVFLVIPALPLVIIVTSILTSSGDWLIAVVIGCTSWAWGARVLRAQTLSLRRRDYVEAARASGESTWRILTFEILPNLTPVIASSFVGTVIFAVMTEITLAFIGISSITPWNWGEILFWAQSQLALAQGAWWWFVPAGLAIALLGTALALINFGIDEFVSPRLRSSGRTRVRMSDGRKVRMRVGFTPVLGSRPAHAPALPADRDAAVISFDTKERTP